jgi:hypothetical protein
MKIKTKFESKTVVFNLIVALAAVASFFYPPATEFVQTNSLLILAIIGAVNVGLRRITKDAYSLFPMLVLCLCSIALIGCAADSYIVDLTGYEKQVATTPEAVVLPKEAVTPIGGATFTGGADIITDQGTIHVDEGGVDTTVVVDLRGK